MSPELSEAELEALALDLLTFKQIDRTVNVRVAHIEGIAPFGYIDPSDEQPAELGGK